MKIFIKSIVVIYFGLFSINVFSLEWIDNLSVSTIELYTDNPVAVASINFKDTAGNLVKRCAVYDWNISETANHRKEMLSLLFAAQTTKQKMSVYFNDDCTDSVHHLSNVKFKQ